MPERQFSLGKLLLIVTGFSFLFGAFALMGSLFAFPLVALFVSAMFKWWRPSSLTYADMAIIAIATLIVAMIFVPPSGYPREASRRGQCTNNLKQISLALLNYATQDGTFPPAYLADASGKPMHSWRVLILPFMEEQHVYDQYRFDEPWNGPNNSKLAAQFPNLDIYRCPSDDSPIKSPNTSYLAVTGPSTVWPGEVGRKLSEVSDGLDNTILLVEASQSGIHWMEPRDLDLSQMNPQINAPTGQSPRSKHPGGIVVVFADGHTHFLSDTLTPEQLRALLTADDQEPIDFEY